MRKTAIVGVAAIVLLAAGAVVYLNVLRGNVALALVPDPWTSTASIHSDLLNRDMAIEVFRPPADESCSPQPVLFLFHGSGSDQRQWMEGDFGTGVGIDAIAHRLIDSGRITLVTIVSAMIDKSYGVDSPPSTDTWTHGPYESYIVEELIPGVEARYSVGGTAAERSVGGLSMGGFAALNAALRHPDLFSSVGALSPAFFVSPPADRAWIYAGGDGRHDPLSLADEGSADHQRVFLGYGDRDYNWIRGATSELANRLTARGNSVEPVVVSGSHDVATWRQLAEPMLLDLFARDGSAAGSGC